MLSLCLIAAIPLLLWAAQSILLWRAGRPLQWRLSSAELPHRLKRINRVLTHVAIGLIILAYPLLRGESPLAYYTNYLPADARASQALLGVCAAVVYLTLLYLAWTISGQVRFELRHPPARLLRRLLTVPLTAVFIALVEELLFRALLLADLLDNWPRPVAIAAAVVIFAGAHYVRSVKRLWTFPGHLALGALFCLPFVWTGAIWLSFGLHAGGVLVLMAVRPMLRYTGPGWLVGASVFPYAGTVGITALLLLTCNLWLIVENTG